MTMTVHYDRHRPRPLNLGPGLLRGPGPVMPYTSNKAEDFIVTCVGAIGYFYGYPVNDEAADDLLYISQTLNQLGQDAHTLELHEVEIGGHYGALYDGDGYFYRCEVMRLLDDGQISVFYLDFGSYANVSGDSLFVLPPDVEHRRIWTRCFLMKNIKVAFPETFGDNGMLKKVFHFLQCRIETMVVKVVPVDRRNHAYPQVLVFLDQCNVNDEVSRQYRVLNYQDETGAGGRGKKRHQRQNMAKKNHAPLSSICKRAASTSAADSDTDSSLRSITSPAIPMKPDPGSVGVGVGATAGATAAETPKLHGTTCDTKTPNGAPADDAEDVGDADARSRAVSVGEDLAADLGVETFEMFFMAREKEMDARKKRIEAKKVAETRLLKAEAILKFAKTYHCEDILESVLQLQTFEDAHDQFREGVSPPKVEAEAEGAATTATTATPYFEQALIDMREGLGKMAADILKKMMSEKEIGEKISEIGLLREEWSKLKPVQSNAEVNLEVQQLNSEQIVSDYRAWLTSREKSADEAKARTSETFNRFLNTTLATLEMLKCPNADEDSDTTPQDLQLQTARVLDNGLTEYLATSHAERELLKRDDCPILRELHEVILAEIDEVRDKLVMTESERSRLVQLVDMASKEAKGKEKEK